jgi:outer membrane immunogenic protein
MIKRCLMATVSCLALTGVASAADLRAPMPVKAPPPAVVTQLWAGPYIGINGGAVWNRLETDTTLVGFTGTFDTARINKAGGTFGGQVGYNWQSQNFVYGLEADLNWVGAKGTDQHRANNGIGFLTTHTAKLSWLATVRARGGVTFGPNLLFVTGGLAVGGVKNDWTFPTNILCLGGPPGCPVSDHSTRVGWTAGGGFERFVTNNLTVKAEALYVDLGRKSATDFNGNYTSRFKNTAIVGRLGLNLKW